ncbi:MAG: hypothetical protein AB9869_22480 [Verrucomicrobiia bacterium]
MLTNPCTDRQTREQKPAADRNKTEKEEEKKTLQRIFSKKTESEEAGGIIRRQIQTKGSARTTACPELVINGHKMSFEAPGQTVPIGQFGQTNLKRFKNQV